MQPALREQKFLSIDFVTIHRVDDDCWRKRTAVKLAAWGKVVYWSVSNKTAELLWDNRVSIQAFLDENDGLESLVKEAHRQLAQRFPAASFTLRMEIDPDEPSIEVLVLRVIAAMDFDEAQRLWTDFNDQWWLPNYRRAAGKLCILLDC